MKRKEKKKELFKTGKEFKLANKVGQSGVGQKDKKEEKEKENEWNHLFY